MTDDKWQLLVEKITASCREVSLNAEPLEGEIGGELVNQGTQDVLEFRNDRGHFRIVRETKPMLLDKKMHYSHRAGDSARTEYVFSDTEFSHKLYFYREDFRSGEWEALEADSLDLM